MAYLPRGGPAPTECQCEAGDYDDEGLPIRWTGVYVHPECPIHGDSRMAGKIDRSEDAYRRLDLAHRGYGVA